MFIVTIYFCLIWANYGVSGFIVAPLDPPGSVEPVVLNHTKLGQIIGKSAKTNFYGTSGKISAFLGIPFAEPPTGDRRFRKPVPKDQLTSPFKAQKLGPACPQDLIIMDGWVPGRKYMDEDCLTINVYVPEKALKHGHASNYTVMVWIYGGAYIIGQSSIYSAENLTLVGDVIVITFNYRISALGFLSTGSIKYPGNVGLWDQLLALQWVRDNIAEFGGDPNSVTVFGNSAGAASVLLHSLALPSRGLVRRLIAQSGSPICPWSFQSDPQTYARRIADNLGCTQSDLDAAVDCLQTKDFMEISNNTRVGTQAENLFRAEFVPTIDDVFLPKDPRQLFKGNVDHFRHLDYLVGISSNDGAVFSAITNPPEFHVSRKYLEDSFIPDLVKDLYGNSSQLLLDWFIYIYTDWHNPSNENLTTAKFLELSGDYSFFMPALETLYAHAQTPKMSNSYLYEFDMRPSYTGTPSWVSGSNHGDELPFVFGFPDSMADGMHFHKHVPDYEKQISRNMMIMWSNFAKSGYVQWPFVISVSLISNIPLSRTEKLVRVLKWKSNNR